MFSLFVVLVCLAVVSLDDYQTHRHSSHNPACLTDMGLPAGKVKSEQDQRRWIPLWAALIVQTSQRKKIGRNSLDFSCGFVEYLFRLIGTFQKTPILLICLKFLLPFMLINNPVNDHHGSVFALLTSLSF